MELENYEIWRTHWSWCPPWYLPGDWIRTSVRTLYGLMNNFNNWINSWFGKGIPLNMEDWITDLHRLPLLYRTQISIGFLQQMKVVGFLVSLWLYDMATRFTNFGSWQPLSWFQTRLGHMSSNTCCSNMSLVMNLETDIKRDEFPAIQPLYTKR
jgi:hypothetical protein